MCQPVKKNTSHLILVDDGRLVPNLPRRSPHPSLLHARAGLDEVPRSLEEQVVVVVQRVHGLDGEVHLDYIRGRLDVHRQGSVGAEAVPLDRRRVRPRDIEHLWTSPPVLVTRLS